MIDLNTKSEARTNFENVLKKRVVGQEDAVNKVSEAYSLIDGGMTDDRKPLANLLLLGPTGVGKTLLVDSVAEAIHGDSSAKTVINCAEYSEDHQIARLIGAPPGYIGHDTAEPVICPSNLTRGWVEGGPKISVILLDEIEKASFKLHQLLLGIMDKAEMSDGKNRIINLSRSLIFMTSNIGSRVINQDHIGFTKKDEVDQFKEMSTEATSAAKKKFAPEFMGRITDTIVFRALNDADLNKVLDLELWKVWERSLRQMIVRPEYGGNVHNVFTVSVSNELRKHIISIGQNNKHGARNLSKTVQKFIATPLATIIANRLIIKPGVVKLGISKGVVTATFKEHDDNKKILEAAVDQYVEQEDAYDYE